MIHLLFIDNDRRAHGILGLVLSPEIELISAATFQEFISRLKSINDHFLFIPNICNFFLEAP